jgi:hypothetical protein
VIQPLIHSFHSGRLRLLASDTGKDIGEEDPAGIAVWKEMLAASPSWILAT